MDAREILAAMEAAEREAAVYNPYVDELFTALQRRQELDPRRRAARLGGFPRGDGKRNAPLTRRTL